MTRARNLSRLGNSNVLSVDNSNNVGIASTIPDAKLDVVGVVSATKYYGDGSELTGITAGATLSAGSGAQRVVVTSLTTGTMTAAATDADLAWNSSTNTLSATNITGALTGNVTGNTSGSSGSCTGNAGGLTGTPNISCGTIDGSTGSFTGDVDIADKIVHTGDTNTALRFPANDTFTVETGGDERLRITSTGLVGINSTAPSTKLDVNGDATFSGSITAGTAGGSSVELQVGSSAAPAWYYGGQFFSTSNSADPQATVYARNMNSAGRTFAGVNDAGTTTAEIWGSGAATFAGAIKADAGIDFSGAQTTSSVTGVTPGSEILDAYEEGTWTPTNAGGTVNSGTWAASGSYTKIGNIVTVYMAQTGGNITWSAGAWLIGGLPFPAVSPWAPIGVAGNTSPNFTSSVMIWTASNIYIASAGSNQTGLRIAIAYRTG